MYWIQNNNHFKTNEKISAYKTARYIQPIHMKIKLQKKIYLGKKYINELDIRQ